MCPTSLLPPLGSSPKTQQTRCKRRSRRSPRATQRRRPRCTRNSPRRRAHSRRSSSSAFVEGTGDPTVARAQSPARKRDDLEHDVAALKRAVHELSHVHVQAPSSPSPSSSSSRPATPASWTSLATGLFASASGAGAGSGGGGGGSSSRPASPAPTFGAVVTSPPTRRAASASGEASPLAALQQQLRMPMPELHHPPHHLVAPLPSPVRGGSRARTSSGMYMLGLGMHGNVVGAGESRKVSVVGFAQRSTGLATDAQDGGDFEVE